MKEYPEVHSLKESLAILDKYKDKLTQEQYEAIRSSVSSHAIEDIYANEQNIIDLVRMAVEGISDDDMIKEIKQRHGLPNE
ncbi:hypothetical protein [Campylobacter ureolyticus]|uniref:hypothetical protein n=1 Tax=Campylobacter ureolyticus TaxID=827 RepID=UPI001FC8091B|nr:hypothetical protein [Campylobacter ureolyticus]MCZ6106047.1 hypothetical protein [Campylobacter ureolyticus]MCZ6158745.1 hypothetical protein [Campylobacter ureolyticus]GKH61389.1 hypothetical protein CE91St25_17250 [Campylobacter ureolyticus]